MRQYAALLRGINVGGHRPVKMPDLCRFLGELGFVDPRSLLQSGNLVFRGQARSSAGLEGLLEKEAEKRLGLETGFFVRTTEECADVMAGNPFIEQAVHDPARLLVMFLRDEPAGERVRKLQAWDAGPELVRVRGRHAYIAFPDGIGRSRLTSIFIEKALAVQGTGRNWNTVRKLGAMMGT